MNENIVSVYTQTLVRMSFKYKLQWFFLSPLSDLHCPVWWCSLLHSQPLLRTVDVVCVLWYGYPPLGSNHHLHTHQLSTQRSLLVSTSFCALTTSLCNKGIFWDIYLTIIGTIETNPFYGIRWRFWMWWIFSNKMVP